MKYEHNGIPESSADTRVAAVGSHPIACTAPSCIHFLIPFVDTLQCTRNENILFI